MPAKKPSTKAIKRYNLAFRMQKELRNQWEGKWELFSMGSLTAKTISGVRAQLIAEIQKQVEGATVHILAMQCDLSPIPPEETAKFRGIFQAEIVPLTTANS